MKTKISRFSKSVLSVILAMTLIMSTMLIGTITTSAATNFTVYFENTLGWNDVYVYFFKSDPWHDTNGNVNTNGVNVSNNNNNMTDKGDKMFPCGTSSAGKQILSYNYTGSEDVKWIAFATKSQYGYGQFYNNTVSYATSAAEFDSAKSLWTPSTTPTYDSEHPLNNCVYYNSGTWSTYGSGSTETNYTVRAGECKGGSVTVYGSTSSVEVKSGTQIPVIATANENYEFVSWNAVEGVEFENVNSATTNATITKNATITATFRSTSTEPTEMFYLEYWDGGNHQYIPYTSYSDGVFTWETNFNFGSFSSDGKFRLTNTTTWTNGSESSFCVPAYKRTNQKGTGTYVTVTASGASVVINSADFGSDAGSYGVSKYNEIKLNGIDTSKTYVVTYTPGTDNILDGNITVSDKSVTPTLATPKIKGDSSALPGSTITVALDNQKDFGTDEDGDGKYKSDYENLKFTYTVTASDGTTPDVTPTASGKILASDGTTPINDKISFTASSDNGVTYTITCKVSADDFADVPSSELTVKVGTIPYAQADRIYAYAKTLGADETPALNAWVASETNASKLDTHNDRGPVKPTLGNTSDTDIRIFLPTTASSDKVVLYNSFSSNINVKDKDGNYVTITAGDYAEVSYTPNASTTVKSVDSSFSEKTLTIYKSTADGALYVNNTGDYASIDNNGALSMINQLYSNKEKGEIAAGNAGALADSNGVKDVAVKKIKGRGNSTWVSANKKSFNVNFDADIKAFGFEKGKKFSLLANFKDPSLSRNKILYELADLMGVKYSPDAATVDLYMNGLYMGSYLMCQKVEVGSKELVNDLGKTLLEDLYTDKEAGKVLDYSATTIQEKGFSFLIELDSNATTGDFYTTVGDQKITIKEPEYLDEKGNIPTDEVTKAAIKFVQDRYTELNTAMSNTSITLEQLNNIIDVDSLAKYYLVNEIAKNYDIGVSSTYLVYNYTDEKFYISPLWDMDVTTANCKVDNENYQKYDGDWTDNNSSYNLFMKKVFANPQVQSAARKLWTNSYYTTLTGYIDTLTTKATNVEGSLNCNYTKWNYPYGFQGKYDDNVQARTSLKKATYNPSDNSYTVDSSETHYATTAVGQTQFVSDWLKSRVAWMSQKYNTYTLSGLNGWSSGSAVTKSSDNGVTTWKITGASNSQFKISTDGYDGKDSTHSCINYNSDLTVENGKIVNKSANAEISNPDSASNNNFGFTVTGTVSDTSPVFLIYNQKTNTLTLSDTESTSTKPSVRLTGSDVLNENIKDGTAVTLTATITPATNNNVVVKGDYTATLYIGERVVTTKTVTFADNATEETTMNAVFSTFLEGTNQTYKVVVTCNDGEQDRKGTSNTVIYKQTGVKDQKIYFDPSTYVLNSVATWLNKITETSTVTVTIKDSNSTQLATFKMYIDSEDVYGLAKGVFRADIDETTLGYLKVTTNTIHFELDGEEISTDSDGITINGDANIESGWIYNYSTQTTDYQRRWEQYNVSYVEAYPSSRTDSNYSNITTFAQFKDYIAAQKAKYDKGETTDNIVYFDNSVSKWYNVYIYGWGDTGPTKDAVIMNKLPYADIWYYDFGSDNVTSSFLFKDRSSYGFGNNYQETVDLVDGYIKNGDGDDVNLFFETTLQERANPIFVTQSFYNSTIKVSENSDRTLKYRAFNTQWDEFATILSNTVQTKAVDVYFDLHDKATDVTNIQLYHSSTSTSYTFASEFTRLTQLPNSTIFHAAILLPYTDNGIAFKFDKFVVNYSGGKKTCAMSTNVQPEFTCINTGEVWYEINSDFASVSNDAAKGANLLAVNSPLLNASNTATIYVPKDLKIGDNKVSGIYIWDNNNHKVLGDWNSCNNNLSGDKTINGKSYYVVQFEPTNNATSYKFILRSSDKQTKDTKDFSFGTSYLITNDYISPGGDVTSETYTESTTAFNTVTLCGTVNGTPIANDSIALNYENGVWSVTLDFTGGENKFKARVNNDWTISFGNGTDGESGNYSETLTGTYKISIADGAENGTALTVEMVGSTPTPTISLSPGSTSLTLDNGTASTTLTTTKTNADGATVTYSVAPSSGATVSANGTTFTATAAGTYVVTATIEGTTATAQATITVSEPVTTDYCGVLAYNHSTATFDVTGGGKIDSTDVVLTNGYYSAGNVTTGYTSYDGTTYTVIYALPSTGKTDASTSYSSKTSHSDSTYTFDGWTKDGVVKTDNKTLTDSISGTATVTYVANWSKEVMVTYTFTYKYDMYDTTAGREYDSTRAKIENSYVVQISLSAAADNDEIIAAYLANAPKISSDYFTYTFDGVTVTIVNTDDTHTAEAKAKIAGEKMYKVTVDSDSAIIAPKDYFYQNIAELNSETDPGYVTVWKDEKGNILYVGNTYKFRVTRDIVLKAESVVSSSIDPATYISEPTYEFYTKGDTEYVRFNFRVDNVLSGVTPNEYGTLYFFTDENGVPVDSSISVDENIDASKLAAAAMGSASTGIKKYNATGVVNEDHKFIYAPSLKNTVANRDRYLRVYSYFIYKDNDGEDVVVISADSVIASIRNALNQS